MILLTLLMSWAAAPPASADEVMAEFKGAAAISQIIHDRLYTPESSFNLQQYLGEKPGSISGLTGLLGNYEGGGLNNTYQNGVPNVVNMILWHVALSGLAADVAKTCGGVTADTVVFNSVFQGVLKTVCAWPADSAKTNQVLQDFWLEVMSFDAPMTEFDAWKNFFLTSAYKDAKAQEAVAAMMLVMLNNPYFLLEAE